MSILLPTVAYVAFLAFAPDAALKFAVWFVVIVVVVQASAKRLTGADVTLTEAAKSVLYAAILPLLAMMMLGGLSAPSGTFSLGGPAILVLVLLAGSFIGAFVLGLGTEWKTSAIIASIALAASVVLAVLIQQVA